MNKLLTIFFFTLSLICKGQETKKITIFDIGSYYVEDYYVLNSDKTIRHGEYKKIKSYNGSILENGFYKMGLRDSIWKRYTNGTLSSTGSYRDGEKIGIWKYYAYNGNLEQVYNHSTKELISNTIAEPVDSNKFYRVFLEGDTLSTKLEKAPMLFHLLLTNREKQETIEYLKELVMVVMKKHFELQQIIYYIGLQVY